MEAALADRTEEELTEAAETPCAEYQKRCRLRRFQEPGSGQPEDRLDIDELRGFGPDRLCHECLDRFGCLVCVEARFELGGPVWVVLVQVVPCQNSGDCTRVKSGFSHGPSQSMPCVGRSVDSDDDVLHHSIIVELDVASQSRRSLGGCALASLTTSSHRAQSSPRPLRVRARMVERAGSPWQRERGGRRLGGVEHAGESPAAIK